MRQIKVFNMLSIDGYYAGPDDDISWHTVDDEFNVFAQELLASVDTLIFGRLTYDLFKGFWPDAIKDPTSLPAEVEIGTAIDAARKIVFSKDLTDPGWRNAEVQHTIDPDFINQLKAEDGKDIVIYGSGTICQQLTNLGLIDEYALMISPQTVNAGKLLWQNIDATHKFKLLSTRQFGNGNVLLTYQSQEAA